MTIAEAKKLARERTFILPSTEGFLVFTRDDDGNLPKFRGPFSARTAAEKVLRDQREIMTQSYLKKGELRLF